MDEEGIPLLQLHNYQIQDYVMNYFLNTFEFDPMDELTEREHLVLMMIDNPKACAEACNHYLNFRPDRERELATAFFNHQD